MESWFYSIGITLILYFLGYYTFSARGVIEMLFPLLTRKYWFLSFYIVLYILFPFLNKWIKALTQKELKTLIIIMIVIFSILGGTIQKASYAINSEGSFSFLWFIVLYMIASYIRLYEKDKKSKTLYIICGLLAAFIITSLNLLKTRIPLLENFGKFYQTTNFFIFIESIAIFCYFKDIRVKSINIKNIIRKIAPLTLAVYLIHQTPALDAILYKKILHTEICYHNSWAIPITFFSIFVTFIVLIGIEYLRQIIFRIIGKKVKETKVYNKVNEIFENWNKRLLYYR